MDGPQATSSKPQAASFKRQASKNNCTNRVDVLKINSTERYNYVSKRSKKDYRLINKNLKNARPKLQPASVGLPDWLEAQEG